MLWIMDASINISMEPFRAFVGDNLPAEQRTTGFAMQSFFIGTGAVVGVACFPGSSRHWFGVSNAAPPARDSRTRCVSRSTSAPRCFFVAVALDRAHARRSTRPRRLRRVQRRAARARERTAGESRERRRQCRASAHAAGSSAACCSASRVALASSADLSGAIMLAVGSAACRRAAAHRQRGCSGAAATTTASSRILNDFQDMPRTMRQLALGAVLLLVRACSPCGSTPRPRSPATSTAPPTRPRRSTTRAPTGSACCSPPTTASPPSWRSPIPLAGATDRAPQARTSRICLVCGALG